MLRDIERDRFMTAQEAIDYRLADAVMEPKAFARA